MKIINPNFVGAADAFVSSKKAGIDAYLKTNASMAEIDFDKVRADFPALKAQLTDGMIEAICADLSIKVDK